MKLALAFFFGFFATYAVVAWLVADGQHEIVAKPPMPIVSAETEYRFYYFGASWCGPCVAMKTNVLSQPEVKAAMMVKFGMFITVIDVDTTPKVATEFNITALPTFLIIQGNEVVKRNIGYMSKEPFLEWIK